MKLICNRPNERHLLLSNYSCTLFKFNFSYSKMYKEENQRRMRKMATILCDAEIRKLLGTVIKNGVEDSIRPNSYIIRLGSDGEYIGTEKVFKICEDKGIKLPPGQSVGVSSIEEIDFSKEAVDKIFPGQALHGFLSPTTDLSREGVVVASTQIDAGFKGTLSWTLSNSSFHERCFIFGEKIFRLTIFKLEENEIPERYYSGYYQGKTGYIRSKRSTAIAGMRNSDWIDPYIENGPEELLDELMKAGYPWGAVATRLKAIDEQYSNVSAQYQNIDESIRNINEDVSQIKKGIDKTITESVRNGINQLNNSVIVKIIGAFGIIAGLVISILSSPEIKNFIMSYGGLIGLIIIALGFLSTVLFKPKSK